MNSSFSYAAASVPQGAVAEIDVLLDGPDGAPSVDVSGPRHTCFLLICGGIGVTPMLSICNELLYEHDVLGRPLARVRFVWATRNEALARTIGCPRARALECLDLNVRVLEQNG
jgi:hypothetical protein